MSETVGLLWVSRLGNSIQQKLRHVVIRRFRSCCSISVDVIGSIFVFLAISFWLRFQSIILTEIFGSKFFPFQQKNLLNSRKTSDSSFSREPWAPIYLDSRKIELWINEEKSLLQIVIWTKFILRSEFRKRNSTKAFRSLKCDLHAVNFLWTHLVHLLC